MCRSVFGSKNLDKIGNVFTVIIFKRVLMLNFLCDSPYSCYVHINKNVYKFSLYETIISTSSLQDFHYGEIKTGG